MDRQRRLVLIQAYGQVLFSLLPRYTGLAIAQVFVVIPEVPRFAGYVENEDAVHHHGRPVLQHQPQRAWQD